MIRIADNGNVYYKKSDLDDDIFVVKYDSNKWKIRDEDSDCRWIPKSSHEHSGDYGWKISDNHRYIAIYTENYYYCDFFEVIDDKCKFLFTKKREIYRTFMTQFFVEFLERNNETVFMIIDKHGYFSLFNMNDELISKSVYRDMFITKYFISEDKTKILLYNWIWQPGFYIHYYDVESLLSSNQELQEYILDSDTREYHIPKIVGIDNEYIYFDSDKQNDVFTDLRCWKDISGFPEKIKFSDITDDSEGIFGETYENRLEMITRKCNQKTRINKLINKSLTDEKSVLYQILHQTPHENVKYDISNQEVINNFTTIDFDNTEIYLLDQAWILEYRESIITETRNIFDLLKTCLYDDTVKKYTFTTNEKHILTIEFKKIDELLNICISG